jgi:hypothetical protein
MFQAKQLHRAGADIVMSNLVDLCNLGLGTKIFFLLGRVTLTRRFARSAWRAARRTLFFFSLSCDLASLPDPPDPPLRLTTFWSRSREKDGEDERIDGYSGTVVMSS